MKADKAARHGWRNPLKSLLVGSIHFYQRAISAHRPPACRFTPTCSAYAIEAIERFGVLKGTGLAVWRILRCNPWGGHGYDPVRKKNRIKEENSRLCRPVRRTETIRTIKRICSARLPEKQWAGAERRTYG